MRTHSPWNDLQEIFGKLNKFLKVFFLYSSYTIIVMKKYHDYCLLTEKHYTHYKLSIKQQD